MKQVTQQLKSGEIAVNEVPVPSLNDSWVLVRTHASVISAGTEKSKIDLGNKNLLQKARARPDLVKQVLTKLQKEGFKKTFQTVNSRLESLSPLGYSCAGEVIAVGGLVSGILPGDMVACAGADYANHAEVNAIPKNLVCKIPDGVSTEEAAFATMSSIALQGIRLADPKIGESVLVLGLGLIGQIASQILIANGCRVFGSDLDPAMLELAEKFGVNSIPADEVISHIESETNSHGVDTVLICAGTSSNQPIELSGEVTREKGKVVVVGAVRMDIPREPYFKKEIEVVISRSYGPGRYDPVYEENGADYPYGYVRFTEQRNMETVLQLMASEKLDVASLVSHRFDIDDATNAYKLLENGNKEPYLGILLNFPRSETDDSNTQVANITAATPVPHSKIRLSLVGAGNYATASLLPIIKAHRDASLIGVLTASGRSAADIADRFGFEFSTPQFSGLLNDSTNTLMICSRHDSHARYVVDGLAARKHVYVEKPLAMNVEELQEIARGLDSNSDSTLMVGFNRRFAPLVMQALEFLPNSKQGRVINIRVNAGEIPADHWVHDPKIGGGRLIGEGCHFIELASTLAQSPITRVHAMTVGNTGKSAIANDDVIVSLTCANGSIATITYTSQGSSSLAKEYIEVFSGGYSAIIHDFKQMQLHKSSEAGGKQVQKVSLAVQDKGQKAMLNKWLNSIVAGEQAISRDALLNVSLATILAVESIMIGTSISVNSASLSNPPEADGAASDAS